MGQVWDAPPHGGVVDVQVKVVVVDIHGQLEALHQLVVSDQVVEKSPVKQNNYSQSSTSTFTSVLVCYLVRSLMFSLYSSFTS